ncbi:hypothetical protein AB4076_01385 [Dyella sp. 2RAF44]|uniref:hypothetical protein n=1 Tax=Dyella sp. 2RAF44 TaxID=3233000 RepID=UPI003F928C43
MPSTSSAKSGDSTVASLRKLLQKEAGIEEIASTAFDQIMDAVRDYQVSREFEPRTASVRRDLAKITQALSSTQDLIEALPLNSRRLLARAAGLSFGELGHALVPLMEAAEIAAGKADSLPGKPHNYARDHLSKDVARIIRDVFGRESTATRDDPASQHKQGGALYARVLRLTLKIVGITPVKIGDDIDAGRRLLNNPELERGDAV